MRKIFIDTNIYLGFYNNNLPEFKKLLVTLFELKEHLLVTHPLIDEINRNKLNVFRASVNNYIKASDFNSATLPEHLDNERDKVFQEWNKKRRDVEKVAASLNEELATILKAKFLEVSSSLDKVSLELNKIFSSPLEYSSKIFKNASMRKTLGNPPGKLEDPLGDQLNWVQILENCQDIKQLWFVSNDHDFYTEFNNNFFLNPLLYQDIKKINPAIEIKIFNRLANALSDFNKEQTISSLPEKSKLDQIAKEEKIGPAILAANLKTKFYGGGYAVPSPCPGCQQDGTFNNGGIYLNNKFGLLSYHFQCTNCGYLHDTGDLGDTDGPLWMRDR